jgi:hypothetical protein
VQDWQSDHHRSPAPKPSFDISRRVASQVQLSCSRPRHRLSPSARHARSSVDFRIQRRTQCQWWTSPPLRSGAAVAILVTECAHQGRGAPAGDDTKEKDGCSRPRRAASSRRRGRPAPPLGLIDSAVQGVAKVLAVRAVEPNAERVSNHRPVFGSAKRRGKRTTGCRRGEAWLRESLCALYC